MSSVQSTWSSTPNKKDNLTSGWTSKTIFNYQLANNQLSVNNGDEVFDTIISNLFNYKGTNVLPDNYFAADNDRDSRTFKITMLFDKFLDGNKIDLKLGLYDITFSTEFEIGPRVKTGTKNIGGANLVKLEYYCCVYRRDDDNSLIMGITGTAMYEYDAAGTYSTIVEPYVGSAILTNETDVEYKFRILNVCGDKIAIYSLVVEELG